MATWSENTFKLELKGFEDGLYDARRRTVDPIAYQINREYRNGVDIAQQLMAMIDTVRNESLNRVMERLNKEGLSCLSLVLYFSD